MDNLIPKEMIEKKIYFIRGMKVMIDRDLAELYNVETFNLNKAVKRNIERFPKEFIFQLTSEEYKALRFQIGILEKGQHSKYLPYAFTEQGVAMLSSVLKSKRAIEVNILIMKTFVRIRELTSSHKDILFKINQMEKTYDAQFKIVFDALRQLIEPPVRPKRRIGFVAGGEDA